MSTAELLNLQRIIGNNAVSRLVMRHRVAGNAAHRHTRLDLLGDGTAANPGMTLEAFVRSVEVQADWFTEPSLTAADRDDLWKLLRKSTEGPHILAGVGDLRLAALASASDPDWSALAAFGRGCHAGTQTVRILDRTSYTQSQRIDTGKALTELEGIIDPQVLRLTVSEIQLEELRAGSKFPQLRNYWTTYDPHLQSTYSPAAGARGPEFQKVLDMLNVPGIAGYAPLRGRIRNLHRFSDAMLMRLVANFADTSRRRSVHLVLHTGHDADAFQQSAPLFEDLVLNSPNLVLMLEGRGSLAEITAEVPNIAATYGKPDRGGVPRLGQVMIAGHGQTRTVEMAGTGGPNVTGSGVHYPSESLDLDTNRVATERLLDSLIGNLDPATARIVFAGCLVGSTAVPAGTAAADIPAFLADPRNQSLGAFTEARGRAAGLSAGFTQSARASVGLSAATSLMDRAGNMGIQYSFDPDAFGTAAAYVASGHEPEGLFRAAVEVAATASPAVAETQLRTRLAAGATSSDPWWDEITLALVRIALHGVARGTGVPIELLNELAHLAGTPFLARWEDYGITAQSFVNSVNTFGRSGEVYAGIAGTGTFRTPPDAGARAMRLMVEQGWMASGVARHAQLLAFLDTTASLTAPLIGHSLTTGIIAGQSGTLFPAGAAATPGRIRLALAWLQQDNSNADVNAFLNAQVNTPSTGPELNAAVRAELGGFVESEILDSLGRLSSTTTVVGSGGTTVTLPSANVDIAGRGTNTVRVEPDPHDAEVLPHALNVRPTPNMRGAPFAWLRRGEHVRVMGFTHDWAAIDRHGRLGFVHRSKVSRLP